MKIKEELVEDIQGEIESQVSDTVADNSNGLLVAGLGAAAARAGARAGMAVAARPTAATKKPCEVVSDVKLEVIEAVGAAVNSFVAGSPGSFFNQVLTGRLLQPAVKGWQRNFEAQEGGGHVKRRVVDRTRCLPRPPPPPSSSGSDAVRVVETVTIDGAGDDGEEDRMAGPSKPSPSPNEAELLGTAEELASGAAEAAAAERQPVEAPSAEGSGRCPGDGVEQQQQQPGPASFPAEAAVPDTATATVTATKRTTPVMEIGHGTAGAGAGGVAVPPERPARKRRKSAEAGGWRARYDKDEFESGEALLLASSDGEGEEVGWGETDDGASRSRPGGRPETGNGWGGDEEDAESDELVDVGGEEDDDDLDVDGGGGGARNRKAAVETVKKRNPPNAWKRRCADGDCQLGASFGTPGKPAKYCSAHKDAGMVNVTHRRCEELGCVFLRHFVFLPFFFRRGERLLLGGLG